MLDYIGVGTGGRAPQYFALETLLILIDAAQIAALQCILCLPSYAYGLYIIEWPRMHKSIPAGFIFCKITTDNNV